MKLKPGDALTVARGDQPLTGRVSRVEPDGFWLASPDGMSYRFGLETPEPGEGEASDAE